MVNVIDHLPRTSAYAEALALDEDLAAAVGTRPRGEYRPPLTEFSLTEELLAGILDRLADVVQVQTDQKLNYKPTPLPLTASDMLRQRESARRRARVRELFYPKDQPS